MPTVKPHVQGYGHTHDEETRLRPEGAPRGSLKLMATNLANRFDRRDGRIERARQMLMGRLTIPLPAKIVEKVIKIAGSGNIAEGLAVRLPQGTVVPLKAVNVVQRKRPRLKRARGLGMMKMQRSSHVEKWVNAALEMVQDGGRPLFDWMKCVELLFNEGEAAVVVMPRDAGWDQVPSFLSQEGDGLSIRKLYQRDKDGKRRSEYKKEHRHDFKVDVSKSREVYDATLTDWMARRLPWTIRVIHASDCFPLFGPNDSLDGMLVRQVYSRNDMVEKGYRWEGMDDHLTPVDPNTHTHSAGQEVTVYEWYGKATCGCVYALYEVEGKKTWKVDDEDQKVDDAINLSEEYGLTRLPVAYEYGWHFDSREPQDRGLPFIFPFIQSLLGVDALATATTFHTWWLAFGGKFYKPDPELPPEAWLHEGQPRKFDMEPMTFQALPGLIQDVGNRSVGEDVFKLVGLMTGAVEQEMPGGGGQAFGAGSAQSGLDRSMMRNYLEDSLSQVLMGAKNLYEFAGEVILELACKMLDRMDEEEEEDIDGIPVYVTLDPGPKGERSPKAEEELIVLEPGDAGIVYDCIAFFPTKHGEFLAQGQQLAEFVKQELATFEEFREMVFGDEAPEETRIAIYVNKILNSPLGQEYILELAMEYLGEDKMKQMVQRQRGGQMTEGGTPTAALTGIFPGNPGNVMSGMGGASAGRQELGGAVSAGLGSRDASRVSAARSASASGPTNL